MHAVYSHVDAAVASVEGRKKRGRDENAKALERFRGNEISVLVNVRMLTEGTDLPDAQTVFITRQTTSQILLTQMVGRALRGLAFDGTQDAYIVSFVDEWQQSIRWAEYDPLTDGAADDTARMSPKRPPLQLISIELLKKLAQQMDSGTNVAPGPFTSLLPLGWYRVTFDVCLPDSDEIDSREQLVMVFEDEREGFDKLIATLLKEMPVVFGEEAVNFEEQHATLDAWREQFLGAAARSPNDLLFDIFSVARHVAQGHGVPGFYPFEIRRDHDLDAVATGFIERELSPRAIREGLLAEFERKDRFWRALFPRFEQFRSYYDGCQARLLGAAVTTQQTTLPSPPKSLEFFDVPRGDDAGDRAHWERFLRQVFNFTYHCGAVSEVQIGGRGDGYYNWRVEIVRGNSPGWVQPHLAELFGRIQEARMAAGKPAITSLTITSPGEDEVCWTSD
ncbi:MAG: helicase-related protein [Deltaproteobacteria bacterium]